MLQFDVFRQGNTEYRPLALWSWNHRLEPDELVWQMEQMKEQGLRGFVMHPRSGLLTPYLSQKWFDTVEFCVQQAKRLQLEAWLYDEDPYPSGAVGGRLTTEHPEYRAQSMHLQCSTFQGPGEVRVELPLEKIYGIRALRIKDGIIEEERDLSAECGILRTDWAWQRQWNTYYPTTYSKARPQNRSDTFHPFYCLECTLPEGNWEIVCFYTTWCSNYGVYPSFTDLLNPDAVRCFLDMTYEPYRARLGNYFGNTIPGVFIDEPKYISDPYPWTDELIQAFQNMHGYDIWQALYALKIPLRDARKKRRDFWKTVEIQFHNAFTLQVKDWCRENGLQLIGHSSPEEEPVDQVLYTGNLMRFMKTMSWPGTDLITQIVGNRRSPIVNLGPKLASSAMHQNGGTHALCESFGVMEWGLTLQGMTHFSNWLMALGINTFVLHTFIYSIDGLRKMDAAPSEFYQSPYYAQMRWYSNYLSSMGALLGSARPMIRTALVYPFDSFMAMRRGWQDESEIVRDVFVAVFDSMLRRQIQFDLVDEDALEKAQVGDGWVQVGAMRYDAIVVPPLWYSTHAFQQAIKRIRSAGVRCITGGYDVPADFQVEGTAEKGFVFSDEWLEFLKERRPPLKIEGADDHSYLLFCAQKKDQKIFFLTNLTKDEQHLTIADENYSLQLWDPDFATPRLLRKQGESYKVCLPPEGAVCLVSADADEWYEGSQTQVPVVVTAPEKGKFSDNCLILDHWVVGEGVRNQINYAAGVMVTLPAQRSDVKTPEQAKKLCYKTSVHLSGPLSSLRLVRETSAITGDFRIYANGMPLERWTRERVYDTHTWVCSLEDVDCKLNHFYENGELVLCVEVERQTTADGFWEPLRLMGDFDVRLNGGVCLDAELCRFRHGALRWGSLTEQGYPNFAGDAELLCKMTVQQPLPEQEYFMRFYTGGQTAEILVNGKACGTVYREPFEVSVTDALRPGENEVRICLHSTLENLLYNKKSPLGIMEPPQLWVMGRRKV